MIGNLPIDDKNKSRTERDRKIEELLCKSDDDIFGQDLIISAYIRDSHRYKQRMDIWKSNLCKQYLEGKSVDQLLNEHSDIPKIVLESLEYQQKMKNLRMESKSTLVLIKSLNETLVALRKNQSKENDEAIKIIVSAATSIK